MYLYQINETVTMNNKQNKKAIGYIRISTTEEKQKHSLDYQKEDIKKYCEYKKIKLKRIVVEKKSGTKLNKREKLKELLKKNDFDFLITTKIDRLARNIVDLNNIVNELKEKDKDVIFTENEINTSTSNGRFFLNILGSFAEFEAQVISERTKAGLSIAKDKGVVLGRPFSRKRKTEELIKKIRSLRKARKSWEEIAEILQYKSKATPYTLFNKYKNDYK